MYRGTTPTITYTVDGLSGITIAKLYVTFEQGKYAELTKSMQDIVISGDTLLVPLTQADTLSFKAGKEVRTQVRVLSTSGTAYASDIMSLGKVSEILKEGVI